MILTTRLKDWGYIQEEGCVLCGGNVVENINHLFSICPYSRAIREGTTRWNGIGRGADIWDEKTLKILQEAARNKFKDKLRKLSLSTAVWQERNSRLFQQMAKDWKTVLKKIESTLCEVTWKWKGRREYESWLLCKEWNTDDDIVLV